MGFLVAFTRKMYLTQYIHSIESRINDKTAQKLEYTNEISDTVQKINDMSNSDSPAVKKMQAWKADIEAKEKMIDIEIQKLQTQLQAANTELQSSDQLLQTELQRSFSYKVA